MSEDEVVQTGASAGGAVNRAVALAAFALLPLAVLLTAPLSCSVASGGDRCWSLGGIALAAYPLSLLYALPTAVALWRRQPAWPQVALLNVLAGWTVVGWIVALRWAAVGGYGVRHAPAPLPDPPPADGPAWTPTSWSPPPPGYPLPGQQAAIAEPPAPEYQADSPVEAPPTDDATPWSALVGAPGWVRAGEWPSGSLVVKVCGGFEAYTKGRRVSDGLRRKQAVLFLWLYLLLQHVLSPGSRPLRLVVADEMSPGLDERSQRRQLSDRLYGMGDLDPALTRAVVSDNNAVWFDATRAAGDGELVLDLSLLGDLAARAERAGRFETSEVDTVELLLEGCRGELLPEWTSLDERFAGRRGTGGELVQAVRVRHAELFTTASLCLAQTHLESGTTNRAVELLRQVLEMSGGRQDVARRLVSALTAAGRIAEADRVSAEYLA